MSRFLPELPFNLPAGETLPSALTQLDALLQGTLQLRRSEAAGEFDDRGLSDLQRTHAELESSPIPALRQVPEIDAGQAARAFVAGALRLKYYRQTVLSRRPLIDTLGSLTLGEYQPDLHLLDQAQAERWRLDVASACELPMQAVDDVETAILPDEIHAVALRKRIMDALIELLGVEDNPRRAALRLMDGLFPGHPLRESECDIICTAASVYLCLPYDKGRWTQRGPEQLDDPQLMAFLKLISRPLQTTMAHFPAFAPVQPDNIDSTLLRQLAAQCGQDIEDLRVRLCTMITILPAPRVDQFIVHDVWGHQWQAHLFRFEEAYLRVAGMTRKPPVDPAMLAVLQQLRAGEQDAARAAWQAHLGAQLDANLLDSLTGLIAEVFADAIEHKFLVLHPERRQQLLSSSFFKHLPTKLDLTIADLPLYFRFATRGLRRLADGRHLAPLNARLAGALSDWTADEVDQATRALSHWTAEVLALPAWASRFPIEASGAPAPLNAFALSGLEFARFQLAFNRVHQRLSASTGEGAHPLLPRFQDLLIFCTASFFEQDRAVNFWRLTEFVEQHFEPLYQRLLEAGRASG